MLQTVLRQLSFTQSDMGSHCKPLIRERYANDLTFIKNALADTVLRTNYRSKGVVSERPVGVLLQEPRPEMLVCT